MEPTDAIDRAFEVPSWKNGLNSFWYARLRALSADRFLAVMRLAPFLLMMIWLGVDLTANSLSRWDFNWVL
jgi:hypothetical protein